MLHLFKISFQSSFRLRAQKRRKSLTKPRQCEVLDVRQAKEMKFAGLRTGSCAAATTGRFVSPTSGTTKLFLARHLFSTPNPTFSSFSSLVCCSQERQRAAPTEGNLSAGRPPRNKLPEPPAKLSRGEGGKSGDSSASRLPPHVPRGELASPSKTLLEAEEAAAAASSFASTDLQFATTLVKSLEASAALKADDVAAAAASDFDNALYRRKLALAEGNASSSHSLRKTLADAAEHRRGQLRQLRHALRGDVQALVREGRASRDEAARADSAVEGAFRRASSALEEAAASASERAARLSG